MRRAGVGSGAQVAVGFSSPPVLGHDRDMALAPSVAANEPMRPEGWMTAAAAARYLGLPSRNALYQRVARGQVKALRLGRQMRFRRRDLDALMRAT
jgi:excisionase family DNA binding protein